HDRLIAHEGLERRKVGFGLTGEMDHREHRHLEAEQLLVEQAAIALDVAGLLKRAHPAQAGRRRNADAARQLDIGHAAVVLELLEDLPVNGIEADRQGSLQARRAAAGARPEATAFACFLKGFSRAAVLPEGASIHGRNRTPADQAACPLPGIRSEAQPRWLEICSTRSTIERRRLGPSISA